MNEEKNIETCLAESILAEVASVPQDPQFRSLVNESLDPLKQQALPPAAYEAYKDVILHHQPYTFTSSVRQMKSNLILLLRRLWRFPFGRGTIRSFADMWQHYITRLSGNPEYGIPSRLSSLTDLPSAPLLLSDRKIGGADVADGMSLAQICCGANGITKIDDSNHGWTCVRQFPNIFPSLKELTLNCSGTLQYMVLINGSPIEKLNIPEVTEILEGNSSQGGITFGNSNNSLKEIHAASLEKYTGGYSVSKCDALEIFDAPKCTQWNQTISYGGLGAKKLRVLRLGKVTSFNLVGAYNYTSDTYIYDLIHFEFGEGVAISLNMGIWSPTNALDASRTDLIEEGSTAENNLQQFLSNFKTYIAERLTDQGSGKTLTLSQAVYDTIKDESHLFVFDEGTMTIYAYLTNIKHWTVTK